VAFPRGPELYQNGLLLAYRTTSLDGVPAERWELHEHLAEDAQARAMFADMGTLMRRFARPFFGQLVHAAERSWILTGAPWIPLTAVINGVARRGPPAAGFVRSWLVEVARELACAEQLVPGLAFRTLTPWSLAFVITGTSRLLDLTLARFAGRTTPDTQAGVIKGEIDFLAPEAFRRVPQDSRTDVFALGLVAIELLTGTRVVDGVELIEHVQLARGVPPLPAIRETMPAAAIRTLDHMLAHEVEHRLRPADVTEQLLHGFVPWSPEAMFDEVRRLTPGGVTAAIELGY